MQVTIPTLLVLLQGSKCDFRLCKACCRTKCYLENRDCFGHRILIKTRRDKAREYAALEQLKVEGQSDGGRGDCEQVIPNKEVDNNTKPNETNRQHVVQAEQTSAVRQEQCCQLDKKQSISIEHVIIPIMSLEFIKTRTSSSCTNSKELQNDGENIDYIP
jgi:hypothetical protein